MIKIAVRTGFDTIEEKEVGEVVEMTEDQARCFIQDVIAKYDYSEATKFAEEYKKLS